MGERLAHHLLDQVLLSDEHYGTRCLYHRERRGFRLQLLCYSLVHPRDNMFLTLLIPFHIPLCASAGEVKPNLGSSLIPTSSFVLTWATHIQKTASTTRREGLWNTPSPTLDAQFPPSGLDPKRAKAFNRPTVHHYFDHFDEE